MSTELPPTIEGDGPALLCLHGGPGMSDYLDVLGDETDGWRRIRYTQRGLAPSTTDGPFTVAQHVADAVAVLDALGLEDVVVLGHSWGASWPRCSRWSIPSGSAACCWSTRWGSWATVATSGSRRS